MSVRELDSSTAFLRSSTEKETFARDKLEEMTNNLLAQKESLEMKVIEMKKQTDMYRCMLGGLSDVPLELSGNNNRVSGNNSGVGPVGVVVFAP